MDPVIDILMGNSKVAWHLAKVDIVIKLVSVSVQLCLDYVKHKHGVSLLPSAEVLIQPAVGPGVDKLDNSSWLVQLLGLIIPILQKSNCGSEIQTEYTGKTHPVSIEAVESCDDGSGNSTFSLADELVATKDILGSLLECLNHFSVDKQSMCYCSLEKFSCDVKVSGKASTVEEGVLQLSSALQSSVSECDVLLDGILNFLGALRLDKEGSKPEAVRYLSDPLLYLLFKVLNSSQAVSKFCEKGEFFICSLVSLPCNS